MTSDNTNTPPNGECATVFKLQPDGSGFTAIKFFTNHLEGLAPWGSLALSGNTLYGMTSSGGASNSGTIFKLNTDGSGYAVLKSFNGSNEILAESSDLYPGGGLVVGGDTLYGTTTGNGYSDHGTVFKIQTDGTGYTVLRDFNGFDGNFPHGRLVLSGNTLYGTTVGGGNEYGGGSFNRLSGCGVVFRIDTDGSGFAKLFNFYLNELSGRNLIGGLALSGNTLYGTTIDLPRDDWDPYGDNYHSSSGTVFRINTDSGAYSPIKKFTGLDGLVPLGTLLVDGDTLYGTTFGGGYDGFYDGTPVGTVFRMKTDGTGHTVLKTFAQTPNVGTGPQGGLVRNGDTFYGTTRAGGARSYGTVFKMKMDGTGHTVLKTFGLSDADSPLGGITVDGGILYGTTSQGGTYDGGTVFRVNSDGTGFEILKSFSAMAELTFPRAPLVADGSALYGTTQGSPYGWGYGSLFKVNKNGSGFAVLKYFGTDSSNPQEELVLSGNTLYGTTVGDSYPRVDTVFKIQTDGTGFQVIRNFTNEVWPNTGLALEGNTLYGTGYRSIFKLNTDGSGYAVLKEFDVDPVVASTTGLVTSGGRLYGTVTLPSWEPETGALFSPIIFSIKTDGSGYTALKTFAPSLKDPGISSLVLNGDTLYGATSRGGTFGSGIVFQIKTDGTGYTVLRNFAIQDGASPVGPLQVNGNVLYGATTRGGVLGNGTLFKINLPAISPALHIELIGSHVVLSWENAALGLQSAEHPAGGFTTLPGATNPYTNTVTGSQRFFRLTQ